MMNYSRRFFVILAAAVLLLLPPAAYAQSETNAYERAVWDLYGLFTEEQAEELNDMASAVADKYQCGIYMVVVPDYTEYSSVSAYEAATAIYDRMDLGYGGNRDGEMLFLSMNDRDYALIAHGDIGNSAFTDYGKEQLEEEFLDDFREDDFFEGFKDYVSVSEKYLKAEAAGTPVDVSEEGQGGGFLSQIMKLFGGLIASAMATLGLSKTMKSVSTASNADHYKVGQSFELTEQRDRYLRRTVSTRIIESGGKDGNRPGGGGTSVGSGGFSGHSGKF